jgi:hypothetical protein
VLSGTNTKLIYIKKDAIHKSTSTYTYYRGNDDYNGDDYNIPTPEISFLLTSNFGPFRTDNLVTIITILNSFKTYHT